LTPRISKARITPAFSYYQEFIFSYYINALQGSHLFSSTPRDKAIPEIRKKQYENPEIRKNIHAEKQEKGGRVDQLL
jgi:hypothetical protein